MSSKIILFILFSLTYSVFFAQNNSGNKATSTGLISNPIYVPSIAQQIKNGTFKAINQNAPHKEGRPKRMGTNITVPGKGLPKGNDPLVNLQKLSTKISTKAPILIFDADISQATPSDPTGAVGPNHYLSGWNSAFRIFDKSGNPLIDEASLSTIFPGNTLGDPIILYDAVADRFIITEFDDNPNGFNMAISVGPDPINDGWHVYTTGFETGEFPDYTKFSIWSDGYYVTANTSGANKVFVVEREQMLLGNAAQFVGLPLTGITTNGFYSPQVFNVGNQNMPTNGNATVVYMQDDAWAGVDSDHLKLWTINVNWSDTANSTISSPIEIATSAFTSVFDNGSFSNLTQPSGPDIDAMQATIMNQAQFRKFPAHNSAVFNFVVDTDGGVNELAGIRWFELRQASNGAPWTIHQEGTYVSPYNEKHAFAASMAMDVQGNIGMGYTTVSDSENIAIYYTGRYANDALGTMTIDEELIAQGSAANPNSRYADYTHLTIDPIDDKTFWHIAEYFNSNQSDVVGVFKIAPNYNNDVGVISIDSPISGILTNSETVTVSIFNYGVNAASNFDISYQIDSGTIITETYTGTIASSSSTQIVFNTSADLSTIGQTYSITAKTAMSGDEDTNNDSITQEVRHLNANDIGITAINNPTSGNGLTATEVIKVTINNFGGAEQSNFNVSYNLDGTIVTEDVTGPLASNSSMFYTFTQTGDFSTIRDYNLSGYTSLSGDSDTTNDATSVIISHVGCTPVGDCSWSDGFTSFTLGGISNLSIPCGTGYDDFTSMSTDLDRTVGSFTIVGQTGWSDENASIFIDFNDNGVFESDELVIDNQAFNGTDTDTDFNFDLDSNTPLGQHILRARAQDGGTDGVLNDPCDDLQWGATHDYTVNVTDPTVGVDDHMFGGNNLVVIESGDNVFDVSFETTAYFDDLIISVYNTLGQRLVFHRLKNNNGTYSYNLDLSYTVTGVYLIRLGNKNIGKVKRIIVK